MISASNVMLTLVLLSIAVTSVTTVLGETQWTRYGSTPILSTPGWASGGLFHPHVIYDGKTFRMWYSGGDSPTNFVGIGYATSTDGMKWVENAEPVLTAADEWEGKYISIGSVIWTGSQFMMWYSGRGGKPGSDQAHGAVGLATSSDGVTWKKYSGNPVMTTSTVDSKFLFSPYVIQVGSSFKIWYTCLNPSLSATSICYATSNDGMSWTPQSSPVMQPLPGWEFGSLYSPNVIYNRTVYEMWYSGCNSTSSGAVCQIGYATSQDGITWTRDPNNPIFSSTPSSTWDAGGVERPCAVQYNGGILLYYDGYGTGKTSLRYIGLAQSPPNFTLLEGTPLMVITTDHLLQRRSFLPRGSSRLVLGLVCITGSL